MLQLPKSAKIRVGLAMALFFTLLAIFGPYLAPFDPNASLTTAIALYRSAGWVDVPAYNDNPEATNWFAKDLTG